MNSSNTYHLSNIDPDEISHLILKIEKSFHIRFDYDAFAEVETFGEFCDMVADKLQGTHSNDCSSQQAYYKIREAIALVQGIDKAFITPDSELQLLFPRYDRNKKIRRVQQQLGVSFNILSMQTWFAWLVLGGILGSLLLFFVQWLMAAIALVCFIAIGWLAGRFLSKELKINTVKQLTEKLSREHYIALRRNATTINRSEIAPKVKELFKADLVLEDHLLTRDATFS